MKNWKDIVLLFLSIAQQVLPLIPTGGATGTAALTSDDTSLRHAVYAHLAEVEQLVHAHKQKHAL